MALRVVRSAFREYIPGMSRFKVSARPVTVASSVAVAAALVLTPMGAEAVAPRSTQSDCADSPTPSAGDPKYVDINTTANNKCVISSDGTKELIPIVVSKGRKFPVWAQCSKRPASKHVRVVFRRGGKTIVRREYVRRSGVVRFKARLPKTGNWTVVVRCNARAVSSVMHVR